jgi:hypothetical protein
MGLKQADIFGGHKEIKKKTATPTKKKVNKLLKQKIDILYAMYEELYRKQNIGLLEQRDAIIKNNIIAYPEEKQAEPTNIIKLSIYDIDERIKVMRQALRDD